MSSISSVAGPSQRRSSGPQSLHAAAAVCHCSNVVCLYLSGSKAGAMWVVMPERRSDRRNTRSGRRPVLFHGVPAAVGPGAHRAIELARQLGVDLADLLDRLAHAALRRDPRALGGRAGSACPSTEADGACELALDGLQLVLRGF